MTQSKSVHDIGEVRREYADIPLDEDALAANPLKQFESWYQEAASSKVLEPNAMILSTVDPNNRPTMRTVLLKYYDAAGFVFYTNLESRKADHLRENNQVSLLFLWLPLQRQLEINGHTARVSTAESIKYFATRPRGSQLGAWVSAQSTVITSRGLLESKLQEMKRKFSGGKVPVPSFWGGYRVIPHRFEFWQGRPNRLHDRFEYVRQSDDSWLRQRLAP